MAGKKRPFAPAAGDELLRAEYMETPIKVMAVKIGRSNCYVRNRLKALGLVVPPEVVERNKNRGRYVKGDEPMNKGKRQTEYMTAEQIARCKQGEFKKGQKPHNTKGPPGTVTVRKDSSGKLFYKYIKVADGVWDLYQRHVWREANGEIPDGYIIRFIDGDQMNCELSNLMLVSTAENRVMNSGSTLLSDGNVAMYLMGGKYKKDKSTRETIMKVRPDLIEAKRMQLLLKRKIKSLTKTKTTNDNEPDERNAGDAV
jgi:hypothetical protein